MSARSLAEGGLSFTRCRPIQTHLTHSPNWRRTDSITWLVRFQLNRLYSDVSNREAQIDGRARLSRLWAPSGGIAASENEDAHSMLVRAGFLRQAHTGIFHLLPLGRRVQDKLETLIDKHMYGLGASKLALSSISSEEIWSRSGRLDSVGSELFRFKDRKDTRYLLSPTHEEEITTLVAGSVKSYKQLPVRLYQTTRKYRDERRPRQGLLRSREFVMKDLYTFDYSPSLALDTYYQVRETYARLFDELKLPYLVAEADSGSIGGNLSHEFHFPTPIGEDSIISCKKCNYVANEELAEIPSAGITSQSIEPSKSSVGIEMEGQDIPDPDIQLQVERGITRDRLTLVNIWYASPDLVSKEEARMLINPYAIKSIVPEYDASVDDPVSLWEGQSDNSQVLVTERKILNLIDGRLPSSVTAQISAPDTQVRVWPGTASTTTDVKLATVSHHPQTGHALNLLRIRDGDPCPRCSSGTLQVQKAIELGHTFHLGTRYSEPLMANVAIPDGVSNTPKEVTKDLTKKAQSNSSRQVPMQMGCHGIGVSRIIGAVADILADKKGLNWPRVLAPFEVVIIPAKSGDDRALDVYEILGKPTPDGGLQPLDLVLDDRAESFPWKMNDADLVGYPIIVVVGRKWEKERVCEVQCRQLQVREEVEAGQLLVFVQTLLDRL